MDETIEYIPQWNEIDERQFDALVAELDGLFESILREQVESVANMGDELYTFRGLQYFFDRGILANGHRFGGVHPLRERYATNLANLIVVVETSLGNRLPFFDTTEETAFRTELFCMYEMVESVKFAKYTLWEFMNSHKRVKSFLDFFQLHLGSDDISRELTNEALNIVNRSLWQTLNNTWTMPLSMFITDVKANYQMLNDLPPLHFMRSINSNLRAGIAIADLAYGENQGAQNPKLLIGENVLLDCGKVIPSRFALKHGLIGVVCATSDRTDSITLAFKGTSNLRDVITDIVQIAMCANTTYLMALGLASKVRKQLQDGRSTLRIIGHSLGGGLMQFAVAGLRDSRTHGYGYNSAGLGRATLTLLPQPILHQNIHHFRVRKDIVMATGFQQGTIVQYSDPEFGWSVAHGTATIRKVLHNQLECEIG